MHHLLLFYFYSKFFECILDLTIKTVTLFFIELIYSSLSALSHFFDIFIQFGLSSKYLFLILFLRIYKLLSVFIGLFCNIFNQLNFEKIPVGLDLGDSLLECIIFAIKQSHFLVDLVRVQVLRLDLEELLLHVTFLFEMLLVQLFGEVFC